MRASHILVKHNQSRRPSSWKDPVIIRSKEEALELLQNIRNRITSNGEDFSLIAQNESDCSSAKAGGDLGWFSKGKMQPPFEQAVLSLKIGELSQPVYTDSGVHIILRTG
eukprot:Sdes_comp19024_c0_seq2m9581